MGTLSEEYLKGCFYYYHNIKKNIVIKFVYIITIIYICIVIIKIKVQTI